MYELHNLYKMFHVPKCMSEVISQNPGVQRVRCMGATYPSIGGGNASLSQINGQVGGSGRGVIAASRHQWSKRGGVRYVGGVVQDDADITS